MYGSSPAAIAARAQAAEAQRLSMGDAEAAAAAGPASADSLGTPKAAASSMKAKAKPKAKPKSKPKAKANSKPKAAAGSKGKTSAKGKPKAKAPNAKAPNAKTPKNKTPKAKTKAKPDGSANKGGKGGGATEAEREEKLAKRRERDRKNREKKKKRGEAGEEAEAEGESGEEAAESPAKKKKKGPAPAKKGKKGPAGGSSKNKGTGATSTDGGAAADFANLEPLVPPTTRVTSGGVRVTLTDYPAPDLGEGWITRLSERVDVKNKSRRDKSWLNAHGRHFKTHPEIQRYRDALAEAIDGDEEEAWAVIREVRRLKKRASTGKNASDDDDDDDGEGASAVAGDSSPKKKAKKTPTKKGVASSLGSTKAGVETDGGDDTAPMTPSSAKKPTAGTPKSKGKPKYIDMIHGAIKALKERSGSSVPAITKYLLANFDHLKQTKPNTIKHNISLGIKNGCKENRFTRVKGSYKLNQEWVKIERAKERAKEAARRKKERARQKELEKQKKKKNEVDAKKKAAEAKIRKAEQERLRKERLAEEERKRIENMTPEEKAELERKKAEAAERQRIKDEAERRKKEIADRIKKRRYPMEDFVLMAEDKQFGLKYPPEDVSKRPNMPYLLSAVVQHDGRSGRTPQAVREASTCSDLSTGSRGLVSDMMQVYHFFCGDVGYGMINADVVPSFSFENLIFAADEMIKGNSKVARTLPPLISHLFVSSLRILTGADGSRNGLIYDEKEIESLSPQEVRLRDDLIKLGSGINVVSWASICVFYMDAMERFFTTDASVNKGKLPGIPIDPDFFKEDMGNGDQLDLADAMMADTEVSVLPEGYSGYIGSSGSATFRAFVKLSKSDPWTLTAEEAFALLRTLTDDILSNDPDLSKNIIDRGEELYELRKAKRFADIHYKRMKLAFEGPKQTAKKKGEQKKDDDTDSKEIAEGSVEKDDEDAKDSEKDTKENPDGSSESKDDKLAEDDKDSEKEKTEKKKVEKAKPKVTKREFMTAERGMIKANEAYEKALRKLTTRTEPIGLDKHLNPVYFFFHDPERLYIEISKPAPISFKPDPHLRYPVKSWHIIDSKSLFDDFLSSLDVRGRREDDLYDAMSGGTASVRRYLYDDIKKKQELHARKRELEDLEKRLAAAREECAAEEMGKKRSGRLAANAVVELSKVQEEIDGAVAALKGRSVPVEIDYNEKTGIALLCDYENGIKKKIKALSKLGSSDTNIVEALDRCSYLWSAGRSNGALGLVVDSILELEGHCESLAAWTRLDVSREDWISNLKNTVSAWKQGNNLLVGPAEEDAKTPKTEAHQSITQLLKGLKKCLLQLEQRIFTIAGLAMAQEAADEADRYAKAHEDDDAEEDKEDLAKQREIAALAWKKKINSLATIPTKRAAAVRDVIIAAIAIARRANLTDVMTDLRSALQLHRPMAAGAAKVRALEVLANHGGYEKPDDEESGSEDEMEVEVDQPGMERKEEEAAKIESLLCGDAMMLFGSLGGDDDADRVDWKDAVKTCKTLSGIAALTETFVVKGGEMLNKIESDEETLKSAIKYWNGPGSKKRGSKKTAKFDSATEVWTDVELTQKFVWAKAEGYPWWPARVCKAKSKAVAKDLTIIGRELVSFVGQPHIQAVSKEEEMKPYCGETGDMEDLSQYGDDTVKHLKASIQMTRRILKSRGVIKGTPMKPKRSSNIFEEKKTAL